MSARGKYKPEMVNAICRAIATTGKDSEGWKAGGICPDTFYRWLRSKKEFTEAVARAKDKFRARLWKEDPEIFYKAVEGLIKHLEGNDEEWESEMILPDGKTIKKISKTKRRPSPWAIKLVLDIQRQKDESAPDKPNINDEDLLKLMDWITTTTPEEK